MVADNAKVDVAVNSRSATVAGTEGCDGAARLANLPWIYLRRPEIDNFPTPLSILVSRNHVRFHLFDLAAEHGVAESAGDCCFAGVCFAARVFQANQGPSQADDIADAKGEKVFSDFRIVHSHVEIAGEDIGEGIVKTELGAAIAHASGDGSRL